MKNAVTNYLLTALIEDAIFVAKDQGGDYGGFVIFAEVVKNTLPFLEACGEGAEEYPPDMAKKLAEHLREETFGLDQWYRLQLQKELGVRKEYHPDEFALKDEARFREQFRKMFTPPVEPPDLGWA